MASKLHPIVKAAAKGRFPDWTVAGTGRRAHMRRVSKLMRQWAEELGLNSRHRDRWAAAGLLHDVLREERHDVLRSQVPGKLAQLPGPVLHGPAAAQRLKEEGVSDKELLQAVSFHTLGHPRFRVMGRALGAADFLEPRRTSLPELRKPLRKLMPKKLDHVVFAIMSERLRQLLAKGRPVSQYSVDFWNVLVRERNG